MPVMFFRLALPVVFSILWVAASVSADRTFKCGTRLVSVGDMAGDVLEACGEPDRIERREEGEDTWISQLYDYEEERYKAPRLIKGPIQVEIWTYDFGSNRFIRYLHFLNGELIRIETGEKGSP
jgi:hypothetical protein